MKFAVAFCGGCQSRFNRKEALETIIKQTGIVIEYAKEDKTYNYLLSISGCTTACQNLQKYNYDKLIRVSSINDIELAISKINEYKKPL